MKIVLLSLMLLTLPSCTYVTVQGVTIVVQVTEC
jgi:hypothetical protein